MTPYLLHIGELALRAASTLYGWALAACCGAVSFFAPEGYAFGVVFAAIALDGVFGVAVSVKRRRFATSELGRLTLLKIATYSAALILAYLVERLCRQEGPFVGIRIAAAWAAACEFWSWSASVLVLWPGCPFVRLWRRQLSAEIAAKTGVRTDDILKE
ncbi:hypothetical protein [uncultured Alistipes sp.]|uniref:hypothetical protein n=1 Tax=uncultured Alistipes sp. TaxID=538949 RepID=UPI00261C9FE2|nr:hypothetical protein [uncultured Alistipes sp.]